MYLAEKLAADADALAGRCAGHCATRSKSAYLLPDFARTPDFMSSTQVNMKVSTVMMIIAFITFKST